MHPDAAQHIPKPGYGYVYHITVAGRNYIGISTTAWSKRWAKHKQPTSGCTKLVKALTQIRSQGRWDSITVEFLQDAKQQRLDQLQRKYIKKYGSYRTYSGLNSTPGGRDVYPFKKHKHKKKHKFILFDLPVFSWQCA